MSAVPKKKFTEAEYLAIERAAAFKSEYYDGEIFAMAGASMSHNFILNNLHGELYAALKNSKCHALISDMRVKSERARAYTYPDIVVVCGEPELADEHADVLLNPTVIVEVLSPSTEDFDRGGKRRRYQRIESLQEYIIVAQDEADIEQYVRQKNNRWEQRDIAGLESELAFASIPAKIRLADIYANIALPDRSS